MKPSTALLSCLFLMGLGVFIAVCTVIYVVHGEFLNAVVTLGGAVLCFGFVIPFFTIIPGKVAPRVNVDEGGTTFWPDRSVEMPLYVGLLGAVATCAMYTIFAPAGMVTIPVPHYMRYSIPFTSGVIMVWGGSILWRYFRRGSTKYLRLTPSGFELEENWRTASGQWDQVKDVADESSDKKRARSGPIVFVMSDDSTPTIAANGMTPNGEALRELVRFYWEHPESRDELTDGGAVERLARSMA
ncbi:hypothetical protein MycrhN_2511 [Mycolicibacterium rhodesiae NBB3]|uniref:Uncharacterized protein n=1 Tax=Mycolicibacterium rhodesiae (strain NBB3) TaxID=710685 RepID=G8RWG7_MYCRN|nr:hypothetical protein [Mycolicibacterium rhodesiae]AEV73099.1 hypothetical protein MycrhN_2511 [Mycolicibacterium rhodesiae NBB3]